MKGDDLRKVNPTNLFAALKVFDPSFAVLDDEGMFDLTLIEFRTK